MQSVTLEDYGAVVEPGQVKFSPDGSQLAYVHKGEVYVLLADGNKDPVKLSKAGSGYANVRPRWSLDGKKLYLLYYDPDRQTCEIYAATVDDKKKWSKWAQISAKVWDLNLSPDDSQWLLSADEHPTSLPNHEKVPDGAPIVIDAMVFKEEAKGYLATDANNKIYAWAVSASTSTQLTDKGGHDTQATWSPDGAQIIFIREDLSKADYRSDLCTISSAGVRNLKPKILASSPAERRSPAWSPDGQQIAYFWRDCKRGPYAVTQLAVLSLDSGRERVLTKKHNRMITSFQFSADGRFLYFLYDNEGGSHLARVRLSNSRIENLLSGERYITSFDLNADGYVALTMKTMNDAADIYIMKDAQPKRRTHVNCDYFKKKNSPAKSSFIIRRKRVCAFKPWSPNRPVSIL